MNAFESYLHTFLFGYYPYICMVVFLAGSLARFDRDQYTWKSDSSQMLRAGTLRWGSNLFHIGILFLFIGHFVGLLTPHWVYEPFISPANKQLLAIIAGGVAGFICFVGLTLLIYRRMFDPRIRLTSHRTDLAILIILWAQLTLGLITLPYSLSHADGSVMLVLADWAQRVFTFRVERRGVHGRAGVAIQGAHRAGHDDLSAVPVQPAGACVERFRHYRFSVPPAPGGAQPPSESARRPQPAAPRLI